MQIKYLSNTSFYIETEYSNILTDVYRKNYNINYEKYIPDILVYSTEESQEYDYNSKLNKDSKILNIQGEYEIKNTLIQIFTQSNQNNIFVMKDNNITLMFLGKTPMLDNINKIVETYPNVDILISPISGENIKIDKLTQTIEQIEPNIFIPMLYKESDIGDISSTTSIEDLKQHFSTYTELSTYKAKKSDLSDTDKNMKVVILNI